MSFGAYLLGKLGYGVLTFNDVPEAYDELMKQIEQARVDLQEFYNDKAALRAEFKIDNDAKVLCVTLGSRKGEILRHLPIFIPAIQKVYDNYKNLLVIFTLVNHDHETIIKPFLKEINFNYLFSYERLKSYALSDLALAKSGTNTLEVAASGTPMVVAYKVNIFSFLIIRALIKIKYVTLINIIAGREIIPEFIQFNCNVYLISRKLKNLLSNTQRSSEQVEENYKVLHKLGFKSNKLPTYIAAEIIKREFLK